MVFDRGRRANNPTRGKRVTETDIKIHKGQSGTGGAQLHSECPNRAKSTLEAPSHPNIRSHEHRVLPARRIGSRDRYRVHTGPPHVPFHPTTLASHAITFKGFLTTHTLPREEVVTSQGPIHRAQPPFHSFLLYRESNEPDLTSCRGRSKCADPFSPELPRLPPSRKEVSDGSVSPRGPSATPLATGTVRFLGPPEALGLFLLEAV
ncbi:hypothetical protein CRG98_012251 [Punica granatum]|uniref:Uncharacterized protein n=1 Tax=Punica granatum TaxID=22663 RepID=A0A2I0KFS2_PUNGR|nr:hypothetical protein CRG98_012251 [Punica granatum]